MYKILAVDDDTTTLGLLEFLLTKHGYEITTCNNGQEGVKKAQQIKPEVIILDVMMPDMDGWEVYQQMKADEATREIPVIVVKTVSTE